MWVACKMNLKAYADGLSSRRRRAAAILKKVVSNKGVLTPDLGS